MTDYKLEVIDLDQKLEGYRLFLSAWVFGGNDLTVVVDPGPSSTIDKVVDGIAAMGIKKVDLILLTHIHLDHGGGVSEMIKAFPDARVFCHESGRKHIIDPQRLWQGSVKVLGRTAEVYGEPGPVRAECMMTDASELKARGISVIPTPGHAPHHVSFLIDDVLFAGETFGTRVPLASGHLYLRPATPPRFFLNNAIESIDRVLALDKEPLKTIFAHYGSTGDTFAWAGRAREQLVLWVDTIRALYAESEDHLEQRLYDRLMEVDPMYGQGRFAELPADIQKRERGFLANTLDGMLGHIKSNPG